MDDVRRFCCCGASVEVSDNSYIYLYFSKLIFRFAFSSTLPVAGNGEVTIAWRWFVCVEESMEFAGMSFAFRDVSSEFELSSTTSKVGHDDGNDCDVY